MTIFQHAWWPMNVVLIFYTFGKIKKMEKTAIMQSPKTKRSFDVKLIQFNRFSVSNLLNIFSLLKTYVRITTKFARNFKNNIELFMSSALPTMCFHVF